MRGRGRNKEFKEEWKWGGKDITQYYTKSQNNKNKGSEVGIERWEWMEEKKVGEVGITKYIY